MNLLEQYGVTERFLSESALYPTYQLAQVIAQHRGLYRVVTEKGVTLAEISGRLRHTTTAREMFPSPFGGVLIDTPGMRELGAESVDLEKTFDDIEALASRCRFRDCTHTTEPGCAILAALEEGALEPRRYQNYCKLKTEAGYDGLNAKEIEVKKAERMFKEVGGMKNVRRAAKGNKR